MKETSYIISKRENSRYQAIIRQKSCEKYLATQDLEVLSV